MASCCNRKITAGIYTVVVELTEKFSPIVPENKDYLQSPHASARSSAYTRPPFLIGIRTWTEVLESLIQSQDK